MDDKISVSFSIESTPQRQQVTHISPSIEWIVEIPQEQAVKWRADLVRRLKPLVGLTLEDAQPEIQAITSKWYREVCDDWFRVNRRKRSLAAKGVE